jgi:hypothetical protein
VEWAECLLLELPHSVGYLFLSGFLVEEDSAAARRHSSSCKWTHKSSGDFDFRVCSCRPGFFLFVITTDSGLTKNPSKQFDIVYSL